MWMWMGERAGVHHNFTLICLLLFRVNGIREAKHLSHIFGTLGVNLTYIYSICPPSKHPLITLLERGSPQHLEHS
jgi:hypothetical protein